jgi:GntR family transcriptional regulator
LAGAIYRQIADDLREQITAGKLRPGSQLATEPNMAAEYGSSRSTIRLAISLLIHEGLVQTRQGVGTYVAEPSTLRTVVLSDEEDWQAGEHADAALQPAAEPAGRPTAERFQTETAGADAEVASALNIAEGTQIVVRRSFLYIGKEPWSLVVSHYPMDIVRDTELDQAGPNIKGASLVLAEHGHEPVGYRHDICARMPDATEKAFFQLSAAVPVTVVSRITYDASQPIRLSRYVYRADRLRLRHDMGSIPGE